jgi:isocitrate lyase
LQVLVARTDSEAATLITSNIDWRDHAFILGATNPNLKPLVDTLREAEAAGKHGAALQEVEDKWIHDAGLKLYGDAVAFAKSLGVEVYWNWDSPRVREGFFRYQGGTKVNTTFPSVF